MKKGLIQCSCFFFLPFYRKFWHGNVSWYGRRYKRFLHICTCLIYTYLLDIYMTVCWKRRRKVLVMVQLYCLSMLCFPCFLTWNCIMLGMKETKIKFEVTIKLNHIIQCYTWRFTCAGERWISLKDFGTTVCFQLKLEIKINTFAFKNVPVQCMPFYYYYYYYYYY